MILTQCAVCATELGLTLGKKCGRCSTRYCGAECQKQHWEAGGHDKLCKLIKKAGGAEQYNAKYNYAVAVTVAAEACAEDTKGQTCYICTQALHWKTKEGLVRGCACRGTAGFAHVSCLAEQVRILVEEAEENNLDQKVKNEKFERWFTCSLCEQYYHGVVNCALGWACWKTYVGRPEEDVYRLTAMRQLGTGLHLAKDYAAAVSVKEAELATLRRIGGTESDILITLANLAGTYDELGRREDSLRILQDVYSRRLEFSGEENVHTISAAINYAVMLNDLERSAESKSLFRKLIPVARRVLGDSHESMLRVKWAYARALYDDSGASLDDHREAVKMLEDSDRTARRVLGGAHPVTTGIEGDLRSVRAALRAREESDICDAVAAMAPPSAQH